MKYLFIGLGSIGMRHLQNLRLLTDEPIYALRTKIDRSIDEKYNIISITSLKVAMNIKPDVVFITNPTSADMSYAMIFRGSHVFIEKPISTSLKNIEVLLSIKRLNKKICFVGYNFRFHPQLIQIKKLLEENKIGKIIHANIQSGQYLPDWHPNEDYRKNYAAQKGLGGGALLTMSHDIDYAYWLFGPLKVVYKKLEKKSDLEIDVEDTVDITSKTKHAAIVNIHMDYLQKVPSRIIEIFGDNGRITWDYYKNEVKVYTKNNVYKNIYHNFERNDMYIDELKHFLNCVKGKEKPKITHTDIKDVMEIIDACRKSSYIGKKVYL